MQLLADAFLGLEAHPDDLALARRLVSHDSAEHIIAGLPRDHLGARPEAVEQASAARRSKTKAAPEPRLEARPAARVEPRTAIAATSPDVVAEGSTAKSAAHPIDA